MKTQGTVSSFQFFCTLFVCRIIALFTFIITDTASFPAGDRTIVFLPFILVGLITAVPVMLVIGGKENRTVFTLTDALSPALTRAAALFYAAGTVWSAAVSTVRFELFMSTVMFTGADLAGLVFLMLEAAILIAHRGLETAARMSVAVLALIAGSLIYVGITTAGEFDAANLEPPLQNGAWNLLNNSFSSVARTSELGALLLLAPRIRGGMKKGFLFWLIAFGLTISALYTLILGVTGEYGERQMFQLYTLTVLSRIGVIERLDSLICAIWVLCSLIRLSFYLMTSELYLESGFRVKHKTGVLFGLSVLVFALYYLLSRRIVVFSAVIGSGVNEIIFAFSLILVPLVIYIAYKIKNGRKRASA